MRLMSKTSTVTPIFLVSLAIVDLHLTAWQVLKISVGGNILGANVQLQLFVSLGKKRNLLVSLILNFSSCSFPLKKAQVVDRFTAFNPPKLFVSVNTKNT